LPDDVLYQDMFKLKKGQLLFMAIAALSVYFMWISFTQPGIGDLKGDFKQMAVYRNENNTGPIIRVYTVAVDDTLWSEMKKYGDFMLHTKYGNTKVYFFSKHNPMPETIYPGEENFDPQYKGYCIAKYEKNNIGEVAFLKRPYD